jgi:glutaredoxin
MIDLYSKKDCIFCTKAKLVLESKGIPYKEHMLGKDYDREWLINHFPSARTFPVVVQDGMFTGGYTELIKQLNEEANSNQIQLNG